MEGAGGFLFPHTRLTSIASREARMRRNPLPSSAAITGAPKRIVQSAARTLHLLAQLIRTPDGRQLAEISRDCGLSEVTTFRLLQTCIAEGVARKDPERGRYRLSPLFWLTVVAAFPEIGEAQRRQRSVLSELAQRTTAQAALAIPYVGSRRVGLVSTALPQGQTSLSCFPTTNAPMHAIAAGKCYLASLAEPELEGWLKRPLPRVTPHTITDPSVLLEDVRQTRLRGYAVDRQECVVGVYSMAVPVVDASGALAATVQLSAPLAGLSATSHRDWLPPMQQVAQSLSEMCSTLARLP